jgi:hypothetical protein
MKEEALDRIVWRNRFGRSFGPIVWQTTDDDDDNDDETKVLYYYRHIKANKPKTAHNWTRIPAATFFSITVLRAKLPWFSSYSLICFHNLNRLITACHGRLLHMNWILSMRIFWRLAHPVLYSSGLKNGGRYHHFTITEISIHRRSEHKEGSRNVEYLLRYKMQVRLR